MPWRTKFKHQDHYFTHKVQRFPSAVNDSYIYICIYLYAELILENIDTSSLGCNFTWLFFPSGQICLAMNETEESDSISPFPELRHTIRCFNSLSSRSALSNKTLSFAVYPIGSKILLSICIFFCNLLDHTSISKQILELSRYKPCSSALERMLFKEYLSSIKLTALNNHCTFPTFI